MRFDDQNAVLRACVEEQQAHEEGSDTSIPRRSAVEAGEGIDVVPHRLPHPQLVGSLPTVDVNHPGLGF